MDLFWQRWSEWEQAIDVLLLLNPHLQID